MATWWDSNYICRKPLSIVNNEITTLAAGYAVDIIINTNALIADNKMQVTGNDLRIVYWNGAGNIELDRHVIDINTVNTTVIFKTQENIEGSTTDSEYYMYYKHSSASNPPSNNSNIYEFWDDFDNTSNWTILGSPTISCNASICSMTNAADAGLMMRSTGIVGATKMKQMWAKVNFALPSGWNNRHGYWGFQSIPSINYFCGNECCTGGYNEKNYVLASSPCGTHSLRGIVDHGTGTSDGGGGHTPDNQFDVYRLKWGNLSNKVIKNGNELVNSSRNVGGTDNNLMYMTFAVANYSSGNAEPSNLLVDWTALGPYTNNEPTLNEGNEEMNGEGGMDICFCCHKMQAVHGLQRIIQG